MKCILCRQEFLQELSFKDLLFSLKARQKSHLCNFCKRKFQLLSDSRCKICAKESRTEICEDCQFWQKCYQDRLLVNHAYYRYNHAFHDLMVNYKRYGDYEIRKIIQELISNQLLELTFDYYVPIPTSKEHQAKRRFDTITGIFADLVDLTPILLKKERMGAQGLRNKEQRLAAGQSFFVDQQRIIKDNISQGSFLLLDDIYTTGRTLYHARDSLQAAIPKARIESFSICH